VVAVRLRAADAEGRDDPGHQLIDLTDDSIPYPGTLPERITHVILGIGTEDVVAFTLGADAVEPVGHALVPTTRVALRTADEVLERERLGPRIR